MTESLPAPLAEPEVLLFEPSPYGTLDALVQHDGRSVYFYLHQPPREGREGTFGTRACWVRNLGRGPLVIDEQAMREGKAPMLPRTHAVNPDGGCLPESDDLAVVWFEEGNGAALVEQVADQPVVLAVIPPWSGVDGFHGYAAGCHTESPICWPLPDNPALQHRIDDARAFWDSFQRPPDPFSTLQADLMKRYQERFESGSLSDPSLPRYYAIDGGKFPPRGLVEFESEQEQIWLTVGMSLCRQPMVEMQSQNPIQQRRIELGLRRPMGEATADSAAHIRTTISRLAGYPWHQFTWFGPGHTITVPGIFPTGDDAILKLDAGFGADQDESLARFRGDPVHLLWLGEVGQPPSS